MVFDSSKPISKVMYNGTEIPIQNDRSCVKINFKSNSYTIQANVVDISSGVLTLKSTSSGATTSTSFWVPLYSTIRISHKYNESLVFRVSDGIELLWGDGRNKLFVVTTTQETSIAY